MIISENPWHTCTPVAERLAVELLLPVLKLLRSVATRNQTPISRKRDELSHRSEYYNTPRDSNITYNFMPQNTTCWYTQMYRDNT